MVVKVSMAGIASTSYVDIDNPLKSAGFTTEHGPESSADSSGKLVLYSLKSWKKLPVGRSTNDVKPDNELSIELVPRIKHS